MIQAKWFYTRAGVQEGPVSEESVRQMIMTGHLPPEELAWCEGMTDWQPLYAIPDFAAVAQARARTYGTGVPGSQLSYRSYSTEQASESTRTAIIAFIVSLVSLLCCGFVFGPVAIILALNVQNDMRKTGDLRGQGYATAALVIGIISTVLHFGFVLMRFMR